MFDSIEIRKAKNGFVVAVSSEDGNEEYVYDSPRKVVKFVKDFMETNKQGSTEE